ncbi:hypothetical protein FRAHR75_60046 [Frankia sp. Hr75.2]|nr:hypothetical protein FRAHR75_60046 [Frankia sp. Hr75.2]
MNGLPGVTIWTPHDVVHPRGTDVGVSLSGAGPASRERARRGPRREPARPTPGGRTSIDPTDLTRHPVPRHPADIAETSRRHPAGRCQRERAGSTQSAPEGTHSGNDRFVQDDGKAHGHGQSARGVRACEGRRRFPAR